MGALCRRFPTHDHLDYPSWESALIVAVRVYRPACLRCDLCHIIIRLLHARRCRDVGWKDAGGSSDTLLPPGMSREPNPLLRIAL